MTAFEVTNIPALSLSYLQLVQLLLAQVLERHERVVTEDRAVVSMGHVQILQRQPRLLHHEEHRVLEALGGADKSVVVLEELPELGRHAVVQRVFGQGAGSARTICTSGKRQPPRDEPAPFGVENTESPLVYVLGRVDGYELSNLETPVAPCCSGLEACTV